MALLWSPFPLAALAPLVSFLLSPSTAINRMQKQIKNTHTHTHTHTHFWARLRFPGWNLWLTDLQLCLFYPMRQYDDLALKLHFFLRVHFQKSPSPLWFQKLFWTGWRKIVWSPHLEPNAPYSLDCFRGQTEYSDAGLALGPSDLVEHSGSQKVVGCD